MWADLHPELYKKLMNEEPLFRKFERTILVDGESTSILGLRTIASTFLV